MSKKKLSKRTMIERLRNRIRYFEAIVMSKDDEIEYNACKHTLARLEADNEQNNS